MHGEQRDGRTYSSPSPSVFNDETSKNENNSSASATHNPSTELAYLPIGCSVSAKYRGAFCSAQVKAIEKQVKLKVTLHDSGDTITISEEQIVHSLPLRIGSTVTVRLSSSNRRQSNDSNSQHHYSRSGLAAFINQANPDEKQATIKQIIDNSIYTVVFNDGDEKSLRRSSLCLQGIRLYQTQLGQQKILEEMPNSPPAALPSSSSEPASNLNDISSIVAIKRQGSSDQPVFPALVLKRKALADYMWVRSFVDGREYIVHTRDDVHSYHNNPEMQALCRSMSKQATQACEKFIKYNQIPAVWQKKKKKQIDAENKNTESEDENSSSEESSSSESEDEDDELDEETTEEKDSFVAQLFAFMDDRGTPINNIPKVQNYDLDLHRLFKIVRMFGGFNKVTKNDQWDKVHIKMGLPGEISSETGRSIEHAYKKYLFAYEDLSKKLGSMNAPSAYLGGRTSMGSESRRSLIRVRQQQQEEEKNQKKVAKSKQSPASVKQRSRKSNESRPSTDSKATTSTKKSTSKPSSAPVNRKGPTKVKSSNVLSSSSSESSSESESDSSDDDNEDADNSSRSSSSNHYPKSKAKPIPAPSSKKSSTSSSTVPKKATQPSSSSTTKTDLKKISTNSKPISSASQSKLTITIPIAKPKSQSTNLHSMKKTNLSTLTKDEKKKTPTDSKAIPVKTEPKPISAAMTRKPLISSSKVPQLTKTNQQPKQSNNESTKPSTPVTKTSTAASTLPFKPKTSQSHTALSNKDRMGVSKSASSSVDSRSIKTNKINSSSTKPVPSAIPVKKAKPAASEENLTKPVPSTSTMKIPKLSDATKKPALSLDKIPKKQPAKDLPSKIPKIQDSSATPKASNDQPAKPHTPSPTRPTFSESVRKSLSRDVSPLPVTPVSPSPPPSSDEPVNPAIPPTPSNISEISVVSLSTKEPHENDTPSNSNKRAHVEESTEAVHPAEIEEQLSPSKRARRSLSSQESIETFSDPLSAAEPISANRNTQLTYEEISINDILLVTWGSHGTKQYPARCLEKNDEKKELFIHYNGWNSRHDAWIKLDRVIERKDSVNGSALFQQRPRRTSQVNTGRQQHLDSTSSTEPFPQQQISVDEDELNKLAKTVSIEKTKLEESDLDENSQGQSDNSNHVETISSAEDDAMSTSSSTPRLNQSAVSTESSTNIRRSLSTNNNETIRNDHEELNEDHPQEGNLLLISPKRRQSRATSLNTKNDSTSDIKTEQNEEIPPLITDHLDQSHPYPFHVKEETIDSQQTFQTPLVLPLDRFTPSTNILASPSASLIGNRRASTRQQKRRTLREPNSAKDPSGSAKKKTRIDNGNLLHADIGADNLMNIDQVSNRSNSTDQQINENLTAKRNRPPGRRGGKKSANQQDYENDDYRSSSPSSITMRQQLKDMFKHRPSRYNFLELNNSLTGDERINHLKDRMRECQKVFFNLKSALVKVEKQRKGFLRKQKPILNPTAMLQSTTTEMLAPATCT